MSDDKKNQVRKPAKGPERKANRRGAARLAAVQALYQMDIARRRHQRHFRGVRKPLARQ